MPKNLELLKSYSGIFGHQVILKQRKGKLVMTIPSARPKVKPSEKQVAARNRFKLAAVYARNAIHDPELLALYTPKSTKSVPPYQMAVNDYLKKPCIRQVNASGYHGNTGEKITVTAVDDFRLDAVTIKISGPDGGLIEEGACVLSIPSGNYVYTSTVQVSAPTGVVILARAKDTPGNVAELAVTL